MSQLPAFQITSQLPPEPQWFHMAFRNGWGLYVQWGYRLMGDGLRSAEVEITYRHARTGEIYGNYPPEKIASLMWALMKRSPRIV